MTERSYKIALVGAILWHVCIAILLLSDNHNARPVLSLEATNTQAQSQPTTQEAQTIQAVSVNAAEVMQTVTRLKQERLHQQQVEQARQNALTRQAELARERRVNEQRRLESLKQETAKMAILRQKQLLAEKQHLEQLAKQKVIEERQIAAMKQQQVDLKKQQDAAAATFAKLQKEKAAQQVVEAQRNAAALAQKQQAAQQQQAAMDAAKSAQLAGEVDKYKALIINAIGRQWILPDNVDSHLSSQFRIRLAPNGAVLEVSLTRSSGDAILDRSAQSAIYKASPLPVPGDPQMFSVFREISLTVRPENVRG